LSNFESNTLHNESDIQMDKNKRNIKILAFEGPDKVGKTTLINEINRRTNYEYLCIDRFTGSAWVYDCISGRRSRKRALVMVEEELVHLKTVEIFIILLTCDKDILQQRIISKEKESTSRILMLDRVIALYKQYMKQVSLFPVIEIDTTARSIEDTINEILKRVNYEHNNS